MFNFSYPVSQCALDIRATRNINELVVPDA